MPAFVAEIPTLCTNAVWANRQLPCPATRAIAEPVRFPELARGVTYAASAPQTPSWPSYAHPYQRLCVHVLRFLVS